MDSMFKEIVLGIKTKEEDVEKTESKLRQFTDGFSKYFKESFIACLCIIHGKIGTFF